MGGKAAPTHLADTHGVIVENKTETSASLRPTENRTVNRQFSCVKDLLRFLELDICSAPYKIIENQKFPFLAPLSYAGRMRKRDWYDPLLLQVLPRSEESVEQEGFSDDAVGDMAAQTTPGLLHKYDSRVLLISSRFCAMHCRFCFRRCYPLGFAIEEPVWRYIRENREVNEVILSGGDPLCLDPADFEYFAQHIIAIPHVKTVRIHTRTPVADPGRVSKGIVDIISYVNSAKACIVVIHANHANELAADCSDALTRLRATGALLLNQSVLLRGINDSAGQLRRLSTALLDHGILPYYLHQLDRVRGAWHFEVEEARGKKILSELRDTLPGYAVPRYVREVAGEKSKRNI
jgi:EF-P beta-lysylation protein EpmB